MSRRNASAQDPLPERWLFSDERVDVLAAARALPPGSGVIFRHYKLPPKDRAAMLARLRSVAAERGLLVVVAGPVPDGGEDLPRHANRYAMAARSIAAPLTAAAHDRSELRRAERMGTRLAFLSPVYETASHPGQEPLGPLGFRTLARSARIPVAALGGMNDVRFAKLRAHGAVAWGAISALRPGEGVSADR